MSKKHLWFDLRQLVQSADQQGASVAEQISQSCVETVLARAEQLQDELGDLGQKTRLVVELESAEQLTALREQGVPIHAILSERETVLSAAKREGGILTGLYVRVVDRASLDYAWRQGIHHDYVVIEFQDETNIPLELVIAQIEEHRSDTVLMKVVSSVEDAKIAFEVLERGSDGIVMSTGSLAALGEMEGLVHQEQSIVLQEFVVEHVEYIGMGDRGCIDTVALMTQDEGIIIGSTSSGGLLVCSETHYLPYMELRPFRVNAGGVHSYVLCPDNTTSYISELAAGKQVLCVNSNGTARTVPVGRMKIERRPLLLIKGSIEGTEVNAILQDDWHVRVMGADGQAKNITGLKKNDRLLGCLMKSGRHVGIQVTETIHEQ